MASFPIEDNRGKGIGGKSTATGNAIAVHAIPVGSVNALAVAVVDTSGAQITFGHVITDSGSVTNVAQVNGSTAFPMEGNTFADTKIGFMALARSSGSGAGAVVKALIVDSNNNLNINNAYKLDSTNDAVSIGGGLMPTGTALNTYSVRITTNTTTTPTSSTAYISSIGVSTEAIGTTSTIKIQDKSGTPLVLVPAVVTTTQGLVIYNFQTPVKMVSGIDIITAGAAAATLDVFMNYYQ